MSTATSDKKLAEQMNQPAAVGYVRALFNQLQTIIVEQQLLIAQLSQQNHDLMQKFQCIVNVLVDKEITTSEHLNKLLNEEQARFLAAQVNSIRYMELEKDDAVKLAKERGLPDAVIDSGALFEPLTEDEQKLVAARKAAAEAVAKERVKQAEAQAAEQAAKAEAPQETAPAADLAATTPAVEAGKQLEIVGKSEPEEARESFLFGEGQLVVVKPQSDPNEELVVKVIGAAEYNKVTWPLGVDDGGRPPQPGQKFICWRRSKDHLPEGISKEDQTAASVHAGWSLVNDVVRKLEA